MQMRTKCACKTRSSKLIAKLATKQYAAERLKPDGGLSAQEVVEICNKHKVST